MHMLVHLLGISAAVLIFGSIAIYLIETPNEESEIQSMLDAVWWTAATVTTVGYGDVVPVTDLGRSIGVAYMFVGITILGIFISTVGSSLIKSKIIHGKPDTIIENHKALMKKIDQIEKLQKEDKKILDSLLKDVHSLLQKNSGATTK